MDNYGPCRFPNVAPWSAAWLRRATSYRSLFPIHGSWNRIESRNDYRRTTSPSMTYTSQLLVQESTLRRFTMLPSTTPQFGAAPGSPPSIRHQQGEHFPMLHYLPYVAQGLWELSAK